MSSSKRARLRRKKRIRRGIKRMVRNVLLFPGRIPPITGRDLANAMKLCEMFGILFVIMLMAHLVNPARLLTAAFILSGAGFLILMLYIKMADYQELLRREQMTLY